MKQKEIENFKPEKSFKITAEFSTDYGIVFKAKHKSKIDKN